LKSALIVYDHTCKHALTPFFYAPTDNATVGTDRVSNETTGERNASRLKYPPLNFNYFLDHYIFLK